MPLVFVQAMVLRNKIPKLHLPEDKPFGIAGGDGEILRVLILGESPAAGYGLSSYLDSVAAQLALCLSKGGSSVYWKACGWVGVDMLSLGRKTWPEEPFDIVFVAMGVNDIKNLSSAHYWRRGIESVVAKCAAQYPEALVVFSDLPPVEQFPALSSVLSLILSWRRELLQHVLTDMLEQKEMCSVPLDLQMEPRFFAEDRFHPSALAHKLWAEAVADKLSTKMDSSLLDR